jgi:pimeloyl-ACP methyl ester carboxylesterase
LHRRQAEAKIIASSQPIKLQHQVQKMAKTPMQDLVVIIPGIMGSVLQNKDGKDIWAISPEAVWPALSSRGKSLLPLKLNGDSSEAEDLGDGIKATKLITDAHLIPGFVKNYGYTALSDFIKKNFKLAEKSNIYDANKEENFLEFPYDWRRDNRANARLLKRLLDERLKQWREHTGNKNAKVIILAHSMGGLISRYYLEVLEGWRDCKALFTFGTPYQGSVQAVDYLINGYKNLFADVTEVVRSLTSVYQLLPTNEMFKVGNKYQRIAETPNLPHIDQLKAQDALKFHLEIDEAVERHRKDEEYRESHKTFPIVGTQQPTLLSASLDEKGKIEFCKKKLPEGINLFFSDGDGTVPYFSAIPLELCNEDRAIYIPERHSSIQNNSKILQELLERLMRNQGLKPTRGPEVTPENADKSAISLSLDDIYLKDEIVKISARTINFNSQKLKAEITLLSGDSFSRIVEFQEQDSEWVLMIDDLVPGLYRLKVDTDSYNSQAPSPVHDLFEVVK